METKAFHMHMSLDMVHASVLFDHWVKDMHVVMKYPKYGLSLPMDNLVCPVLCKLLLLILAHVIAVGALWDPFSV